MNQPNGAGFYDYEDVPGDIYEEEDMTTGVEGFDLATN